MKKILWPLVVVPLLFFVACSGESDPIEEPSTDPTTYQVSNQRDKIDTEGNWNGSIYEVVIDYYSQDDTVQEAAKEIDKLVPGETSDKITVTEGIVKIKITHRLLPKGDPQYNSPLNTPKSVSFDLTAEQNTVVTIDKNTVYEK